MIPPKLKEGDEIRVIAPAHSFAKGFTKEMKTQAIEGLEKLGLKVTFGKYVYESDEFKSASVEHRLEDFHEAIADPEVKAIIPVQGGSTANQLLKHLDYGLIRNNPKVLCGLSDITAVAAAIYGMTGMITYYGPHFTMLGASTLSEYSFEYMRKAVFSEEPFSINPSDYYCDSEWERQVIVNEKFWSIQEGEVEAECVGGNFFTLNMLLGSRFMPDISNTILFMEENKVMDYRGVKTELQAILNQPGGETIRGLILGRFQKETGMTRERLTKMIETKEELRGVPVLANVDFGHTSPIVTFPIGGRLKLEVQKDDKARIEVVEH